MICQFEASHLYMLFSWGKKPTHSILGTVVQHSLLSLVSKGIRDGLFSTQIKVVVALTQGYWFRLPQIPVTE